MKYLLTILFFTTFGSYYCQKSSTRNADKPDTVFVLINKEFKLPKNGVFLYPNVSSDRLISKVKRAKLFNDSNNETLLDRPQAKIFQVKSAREGQPISLGADYAYLIDTISEKGIYKYNVSGVIDLYLGGQRSPTVNDYIYVKAELPSALFPKVTRQKLFLGENYSFSMAMAGYDDSTKYKYIVYIDNAPVDTVKNKFLVNLSDYLKPESRNDGKSLMVEGYYNSNNPISYISDSGKVKNAVWNFEIKKPGFIKINYRWLTADNRMPIDNIYYQEFNYFYEGVDNDVSVTIVPKRNLISNFNSRNPSVIKSVSWSDYGNTKLVTLDVDLSKLAFGRYEDGGFSFDLETEYGIEHIANNPDTKIYKTQK